jgi:hypothetical protein
MGIGNLTVNRVQHAYKTDTSWWTSISRILVGYISGTGGYHWYNGRMEIIVPDSLDGKVATEITIKVPLSGDSRVYGTIARLSKDSEKTPSTASTAESIADSSPYMYSNGEYIAYPNKWSSNYSNSSPYFKFKLNNTTLVKGTKYYVYFFTNNTSTSKDGKTAFHGSSTKSKYEASVSYVDTYTVTFDSNGGVGGPSQQIKKHGTTLKLSSVSPSKTSSTISSLTVTCDYGHSGQPNSTHTAEKTRAYTFSSWNTKKDGTGTSYSSGSNYTVNADVTLYAQYVASDSVGSVTLPTPSNRDGYTAIGWTDGSSSVGKSGDSYTPSSNVTLQVNWSENYIELTYELDGGEQSSGNQYALPITDKVYYSKSYHGANGLFDVGTFGLYKTGHHYADSRITWTDKKGHNLDQTATISSGQALAKMLGLSLLSGNAKATLYPRWAKNFATIVFDSNGATSGVSTVSTRAEYGDAYTGISNKVIEMGITKVGYHIKPDQEWVTGSGVVVPEFSSGTGVSTFLSNYFNDTLSNKSGNTYTLYANWEINTYSIKYETGTDTTLSGDTVQHGDSYRVRDITTDVIKDGYRFMGWKIEGSENIYSPNDYITITGDIIFIGVWEKLLAVNFYRQSPMTPLTSGPLLMGSIQVVPGENFMDKLPVASTSIFGDTREKEVLFMVGGNAVPELTSMGTLKKIYRPTNNWSASPLTSFEQPQKSVDITEHGVTESTDYYVKYNLDYPEFLLSGFTFPEYTDVVGWEWESEQYDNVYEPGQSFVSRYISADPVFVGLSRLPEVPQKHNTIYINNNGNMLLGRPYVKVTSNGVAFYAPGTAVYTKVKDKWVISNI